MPNSIPVDSGRQRRLCEMILQLLCEEMIAAKPEYPQAFGRLSFSGRAGQEQTLLVSEKTLFYEPELLIRDFLEHSLELKALFEKLCLDAYLDELQRCGGGYRFVSAGSGAKGRGEGTDAARIAMERRNRIDYRKFLHRFCIPREEAVTDPDSFDYIPYLYGLSHYGNMPFLEPLEYSEVNRLDELAIAIDTSGSCSESLVKRFLEETWSILRQKENFFSKMRLHLIQCDSLIQEHRIFTSAAEWEAAIPDFRILGRGNTDFCPVFDLLTGMLKTKEIRSLRALLYFTDGDGIYPPAAPPFDAAFVFLNEQTQKGQLPDWAIRLVLEL